MVGAETRYSQVEQTTLALKDIARKLRPYFQAYQVSVLINQPLQVTMHKPDLFEQMLKWAIELSEYKIKNQTRLSLKGPVMIDFIVELPKKQAHPVDRPWEQWCTLHVDRASRVFGSRVGLILQSPTRELMEQDICLSFSTSNNEAKYEVILVGLNLALMLASTKLEIMSDSQLIVG